MYVEWIKHIKDEESKKIFVTKLKSSSEVLERLTELLEEKEASIDRSELSIDSYNTPNWSERQAHKNGNREAIAYLKKLINLDHQKGNN